MTEQQLSLILGIPSVKAIYRCDDMAIKKLNSSYPIYIPILSSAEKIGDIVDAGRYLLRDPNEDWTWCGIQNPFPNDITVSQVAWAMYYFLNIRGMAYRCYDREFFVVIPYGDDSCCHVVWAKRAKK